MRRARPDSGRVPGPPARPPPRGSPPVPGPTARPLRPRAPRASTSGGPACSLRPGPPALPTRRWGGPLGSGSSAPRAIAPRPLAGPAAPGGRRAWPRRRPGPCGGEEGELNGGQVKRTERRQFEGPRLPRVRGVEDHEDELRPDVHREEQAQAEGEVARAEDFRQRAAEVRIPDVGVPTLHADPSESEDGRSRGRTRARRR